MTDTQRTALFCALALLVWVLAFVLAVGLLVRADGANSSHPSSRHPERAGMRTVRSDEQPVSRVGPLRSQTTITHLAVGSPADTVPLPGGPARGTDLLHTAATRNTQLVSGDPALAVAGLSTEGMGRPGQSTHATRTSAPRQGITALVPAGVIARAFRGGRVRRTPPASRDLRSRMIAPGDRTAGVSERRDRCAW